MINGIQSGNHWQQLLITNGKLTDLWRKRKMKNNFSDERKKKKQQTNKLNERNECNEHRNKSTKRKRISTAGNMWKLIEIALSATDQYKKKQRKITAKGEKRNTRKPVNVIHGNYASNLTRFMSMSAKNHRNAHMQRKCNRKIK